MGMRVDIVTLFPEMCQQVLDASIIGRAAKPTRLPPSVRRGRWRCCSWKA